MEVFCESVDDAAPMEEVASGKVNAPWLSQDEDGSDMEDREKDTSFERAITTGDIEITRNYDEDEEGIAENRGAEVVNYQSKDAAGDDLGVSNALEEVGPTETLQMVLQYSQSADNSCRQIKQEPQDENEGRTDSEQLQSKDISTSGGPNFVKHVKKKPGKSVTKSALSSSKETHVTRSGRKSTFTGLEENKGSSSSESPDEAQFDGKSACLVCGRPCSVKMQKNVPNHAFCDLCKRTYFTQQRTVEKSSGKANRCLKKGLCKIYYKLQKNWCIPCHFNRFSSILNDLDVDFDLNTQKIMKRRKRPKDRVKNKNTGSEDIDNTSLNTDAVGNSSSVRLRRMTSKELADYGIEMEYPVSVKEEPINDGTSPSRSTKVNAAGKRSVKDKEVTPKASKRFKGSDLHTQPKEPLRTQPREPAMDMLRKNNSGGVMMQNAHLHVKTANVPETSNQSKKSKPVETTKKRKSRKVLMEFSSSDDDDSAYLLPEVISGHSAVANSHQSSESISQKNTSEASTSSKDAKSQQKEPADTEVENGYTEVLESIKVYVFTCGHACDACNTSASKEWLKKSGFYAAKPKLLSSSTKNSADILKSSTLKNQKGSKPKNVKTVSNEVKTYPSISAVPPNVLRNILMSASSNTSKAQVHIMQKKPGSSEASDFVTTLNTVVTNNVGKSQNSDLSIVTNRQLPQSSVMTSTSMFGRQTPGSLLTEVQSVPTPGVSNHSLLQKSTLPVVAHIPSSAQNDASSMTVTYQNAPSGNKTIADLNVASGVIGPMGNISLPLIQNITNTTLPRVMPLSNSAVPVAQNVSKTVKHQATPIGNVAATIDTNVSSPVSVPILPSVNAPALANQISESLNTPLGNVMVQSLPRPVQMTSAELSALQEQGFVVTPVTMQSQAVPIVPITTTVAKTISESQATTTTNGQDLPNNT